MQTCPSLHFMITPAQLGRLPLPAGAMQLQRLATAFLSLAGRALQERRAALLSSMLVRDIPLDKK